ncbi:hypothetical protein Pmani_034352 [Petrolisthes manimaculis]|uniref:Uncharacterized protein n=1 Tax=Petrolisthes manimaculis TaxID=1843537 RepID=A0AAE1NQ12_9EUCA|nr:hypothetical protein Pmani_034352 [Petrolisthes manimaculis]
MARQGEAQPPALCQSVHHQIYKGVADGIDHHFCTDLLTLQILKKTPAHLPNMIFKVAAVLVVVGVAVAFPSDPYGAQPVYKEDPIPYNFAYGVKDDYAGTDFGHNEDSDGKAVKGSYNVVLPDGRIQTLRNTQPIPALTPEQSHQFSHHSVPLYTACLLAVCASQEFGWIKE